MKKLLCIFLCAAAMLCFSACESTDYDDDGENTSSTTSVSKTQIKGYTTTTTVITRDYSDIADGVRPDTFCYNNKKYGSFGGYDAVYNGLLQNVDYSVMDGFDFVGCTVKVSHENLDENFESNYFPNSTPMFYNSETDTYRFWVQEDTRKLVIYEFVVTPQNTISKIPINGYTTSTSEESESGGLPSMFCYDGRIYNLTKSTKTTLYDCVIEEVDMSVLDDYEYIGKTSGKCPSNKEPTENLQANWIEDGRDVYFNREQQSFIFWYVKNEKWVKAYRYDVKGSGITELGA